MTYQDAEDDLRQSLQEASNGAVGDTDAELADKLKHLKDLTHVDLEDLKPKVTDPAVVQKLIDVVDSATLQNESIASLRKRFLELGEASLSVIKQLRNLIP